MFILARATGWSEADIWDMSYARGLMYLHCHLLYQGAATAWACTTQEEDAALDAKFDDLFS